MAKTKKEKVAQEQNTAQAPQPLLYRNPVPLLKDRHAVAGITPSNDFNFAKQTNSVPINIQEFAEVCKFYPIAFTSDDSATPVAVLGLEDKKNLFVNKQGDWKSGNYVPAYVRRYPFALSVGDKENSLILCVDEGSERYVAKAKKDDVKFFDGEKQSPFIQNAINFCAQYHRDFMATRDFSKELKDAGILVSKQVNVTLKSGKPLALGGLSVVDEAKLANISDELLRKWHKNGILALVYFHLLSGSNWPKLANLLDK